MILWIGLAALLLWMFIPSTDIVLPEWTVMVTDTAGQPLEGTSVTVSSQQYTVETHDTEETKLMGRDGRTHFSGRKVQAIGIVRLLGVIRNLDQGVHASFGVHTWVNASKAGYGEPSILSWSGQNDRESRAQGGGQQFSHLVLQKCSPGYSGFGCDFPDDPGKPVLSLRQ